MLDCHIVTDSPLRSVLYSFFFCILIPTQFPFLFLFVPFCFVLFCITLLWIVYECILGCYFFIFSLFINGPWIRHQHDTECNIISQSKMWYIVGILMRDPVTFRKMRPEWQLWWTNSGDVSTTFRLVAEKRPSRGTRAKVSHCGREDCRMSEYHCMCICVWSCRYSK